MFEVGFQELLLIFVIALVVLGPQKLPGLVAQVGRWAGKARAMARQFREQLESEVNLDELGKAQAKTPPPPSPSNPWEVTPTTADVPPPAASADEPATSPPAAESATTAAATEPVIATPAAGSSPYANPWDAPAAVPDTHEGLHVPAAAADAAPAATTAPGHERQA